MKNPFILRTAFIDKQCCTSIRQLPRTNRISQVKAGQIIKNGLNEHLALRCDCRGKGVGWLVDFPRSINHQILITLQVIAGSYHITSSLHKRPSMHQHTHPLQAIPALLGAYSVCVDSPPSSQPQPVQLSPAKDIVAGPLRGTATVVMARSKQALSQIFPFRW